MKILLFITFILAISVACNAQQNKSDTSKVTFPPPLIVKDEPAKTHSKEVVKFKPPVIVKDEPRRTEKKQKSEQVKFKPPVIVKDSEKKQ